MKTEDSRELTLAELKAMTPSERRRYFNAEPVCYCRDCHSLNIIRGDNFLGMFGEAWDGSYCNTCYSTNIGECSIEEWENMRRYDKDKKK